jgi:hypothetical protein
MNTPRFVSSCGARLAAAGFALLALLGLALDEFDLFPVSRSWVLRLTLAFGCLAVLAGIHSERRVYALWMRFAERLNVVVVTVLFAAAYLVVLPVFFALVWALDPLRLRKRSDGGTFWIKKRTSPHDLDSFKRMG